MPNIRYVCKKIGIDHSTFYRWMVKHFEFHKAVEDALFFGRKNMNDAAESVIVAGIQRGEFKSAQYWLSHNEERYIPERRVKYFQYLEKATTDFLGKETPKDSEFEMLFKHYYAIEKVIGLEKAKEHMQPLIDVACRNDAELKIIFYTAYLEWKSNRTDLDERLSRLEEYPP